jgi:hypothetical protein
MEVWDIVYRVAIGAVVLMALPFPVLLIAGAVAWVTGTVCALTSHASPVEDEGSR